MLPSSEAPHPPWPAPRPEGGRQGLCRPAAAAFSSLLAPDFPQVRVIGGPCSREEGAGHPPPQALPVRSTAPSLPSGDPAQLALGSGWLYSGQSRGPAPRPVLPSPSGCSPGPARGRQRGLPCAARSHRPGCWLPAQRCQPPSPSTFLPLWALFSLLPSLGLPHQSLQTLHQCRGLLPSPLHCPAPSTSCPCGALGSRLGDSPLPRPFLLLSREREGEQSLGGWPGWAPQALGTLGATAHRWPWQPAPHGAGAV